MAIKFECPVCKAKVCAKGVGVSSKCHRCTNVIQGVPDDYSQITDDEYESWLVDSSLNVDKPSIDGTIETVRDADIHHSGLASGIRGFAWVVSVIAMIGIISKASESSYEGGIDGTTAFTWVLAVVIELMLLLGVAAVIELLGAIERNTMSGTRKQMRHISIERPQEFSGPQAIKKTTTATTICPHCKVGVTIEESEVVGEYLKCKSCGNNVFGSATT